MALGRGEVERDDTAVAQMLTALGAERIRLLSDDHDEAAHLERVGMTVDERSPPAAVGSCRLAHPRGPARP